MNFSATKRIRTIIQYCDNWKLSLLLRVVFGFILILALVFKYMWLHNYL